MAPDTNQVGWKACLLAALTTVAVVVALWYVWSLRVEGIDIEHAGPVTTCQVTR